MITQSHSKHRSIAGFTLAETLIATGVAMIALAAASALNTAHLRLVKSGRQSNAATLSLQERVEQMRIADWRKLTNPDYLKNTLLASAPLSSQPLAQISERITISAYPDASVAKKLVVERRADGERVMLIDGAGLGTQRLAQVEFQIGWMGADQKPRLRATTTMISNGGISRLNLPGFGTALGILPPLNTIPPATDPPVTDPPVTDPPVTDPPKNDPPKNDPPKNDPPKPSPTPGNNGNGNGRGNVGGKPGKG